MEEQGISFFIHDLNPYGGQDRSTLEILNELSEEMPVHVYAYTFQNPEKQDSKIHFHPCPFPIRRPVLLKSFLFQLWTLWIALWSPRRIRISTGTCSWSTDLIHVQFVAKAWKKEKQKVLIKRSGIAKSYHRLLSSYNEWMEELIFSPNKHFAAISDSVAVDLRHHFGLQNVHIVRHGVDVNKFRPPHDGEEKAKLRKQLGLPEATIFLLVGAYDRKGLAALALAAKKVREEHGEMVVVAVGSGQAEAYHKLVQDPSSSQWLFLHGPSKEIDLYYRCADVFVLPSLYEPFGLVILEAMSSGLPVIVSRSAGAAELVNHNENGFLLQDPSNIAELEIAMKKLLQSSGNSKQMGKLARATAEGRNWKRVAMEFKQVIDRAKTAHPL